MAGPAVCRVRPDIPAVDRAFDYEVPGELASRVRVGTIVRVELHGRSVRGWVVEAGVASQTDALRTIRKVSSAGPPAELLALCEWIAWRWSGPAVLVLRAASPANAVSPDTLFGVHRSGRGHAVELVVSAPATDRRDLVGSRLAAEGSSIVLVPDAVRASTFAAEVARTGRKVATFTSTQSGAARTAAWATAASGDCVVVGGRAAVLAPVVDLAAIVVLDEADEALKEARVPTWSAREVALERARRSGVPLTFVTPSPTVEAVVAADRVQRPDRAVERAGWAPIEVTDPRDEAPGRQLLGERLTSALRAELAAGRRSVCVVNRKGRARLCICDACGSVARCERCDAALVENRFAREATTALRCERCRTERPRICIDCLGTVLRVRRLGVTRVREALAGLLPSVVIDEVEAGRGPTDPDAPVVVGTESALHRLRAPVGLVAFLEFDQELLAARYRAAEQALWLLVRASRLVGGRRGRVLVQARATDHEVLRAARRAHVLDLVEAERRRREALEFPPFAGLAEMSGNDRAVTEAVALLSTAGIEVLGPHEGRALLRADSPRTLAAKLAAVDLDRVRTHGRLRIEVDPLRV